MQRFLCIFAFTLLAFVGSSESVRSDIMTFNGTEADGDMNFRNVGFTYTEGDWQFEVKSQQLFTMDKAHGGLTAPDDDLIYMQFGSSGTTVSFTATSGGAFDALDVDTIGAFGGSGLLRFTGNFSGGGSIVQDVSVTLNNLETTVLTGFVGLTSLDVDQNSGIGEALAIDSITFVASVPEPTSTSLLTLGCVCAMLTRRRRR